MSHVVRQFVRAHWPAGTGWLGCGLIVLSLGACAPIPNQFREDGPSVTAEWDSPTAVDIKSRVEPAPRRERDWPQMTEAAEDGAILHEPTYFEDPFVDKGDGRTDENHPHDVYRLGWEDYVAFPYCLARHTANWLLLPVSAVVTPPWTVMESDGKLSRQALGYDHDAEPVKNRARSPSATEPPPAEPEAPDTEASPSEGAAN